MAWYWWFILFVVGVIIFLGVAFFIGYVIYLLTNKLIVKRYKPEDDRGRRNPVELNPSRPSQPRYISPVGINGVPRIEYESKGVNPVLERLKRAIRKA